MIPMKFVYNLIISLFILTVGTVQPLCAQRESKSAPGKILQDIKKLNTLVSVLCIAAHPDDENNKLIAYLANEELAEVGYLSLTRGDGGQNLIGNEIREELGILRTQELLAARRIDGGKQYFATANDFGFSKTSTETFRIWNKQQLLSDVVWVIRKTQPDVLITAFSHLPANTHGHHTASAILAYEAFDAAADPTQFPEQLKYVKPWQAKRLLWNSGSGVYMDGDVPDEKKILTLNVGKYNALLGKSYGEIAAESRSMHKCQGMGLKPERGTELEIFKQIKGTESSAGVFEDINAEWNRVPGSQKVAQSIAKAIKVFDPTKPSLVVPELVNALEELEKLPDGRWKEIKLEALKIVIAEALGLVLDVTTDQFSITPGGSIGVNVELINRSDVHVFLKDISFPYAKKDTTLNLSLENNTLRQVHLETVLNKDIPYTQPYWLKEKGTLGLFKVSGQEQIGLAENPSRVTAIFSVTIYGYPVEYTVPLSYKRTDPKLGEVYQPLQVIPPVFVNITKNVYIFPDGNAQKINVRVKAGKDNIEGKVKLNLPVGWRVSPLSIPVSLSTKNKETLVAFTVIPPLNAQEATIKAEVELDNQIYSKGIKQIIYDHIPTQAYFPEATAKVAKIDLKKAGIKIGYIPGAGDLVPESLQQAGYDVTLLKESQINQASLARFDAVVIGIRAYNVNERLAFYKNDLLGYVKNGGNIIVQYNTDFDLPAADLGPYPFKISEKRITDEHAPVKFLNPGHPALNFPNKIGAKDFDGWVQERGSYFPNNVSNQYQVLVAFNDPGEAPLNNGILIAKYGKGNYVYTGLAWFRQLPAGVPGAYRLFANLLGLGKNPAASK